MSPDGPQFIDINPRLVEPVNAYRSGVDLAGALLDVARHDPSRAASAGRAPDPATGRPGIQTHQLLLAVLGAAQHGGRRSDVAGQVWSAMTHRGDFRGSTEELTPLPGDPLTAVPVAIAALATAVRPASWHHFVSGSIDAYSLTPAAWAEIRSKANALPAGTTA